MSQKAIDAIKAIRDEEAKAFGRTSTQVTFTWNEVIAVRLALKDIVSHLPDQKHEYDEALVSALDVLTRHQGT